MKYALALAGGGTRGAYEAGVWQALCEMDKEVSVIAGTSIGALNGAAFAAGVDVRRLWLETRAEDIVPDAKGENLLGTDTLIPAIGDIARGGLDNTPLIRFISGIISEPAVRASGVDFGLCTYSSTKLETAELFCESIPEGRLAEYIAASACFPIFKPVKIEGQEFIDGGIQNNLPVNMLINRGCDTIISVSVGGPGVVRRAYGKGVNIIEIKCAEPEQSVMEFRRDAAARSIERGRLDCKRTFGLLGGARYYIESKSYLRALGLYGADLVSGLESAAELLGLDELREYSFTDLAMAVTKNYEKNERLSDAVKRIYNAPSRLIRRKSPLFDAANSIIYLKKR